MNYVAGFSCFPFRLPSRASHPLPPLFHTVRRSITNMQGALPARGQIGQSWEQDSDKPYFHVMPRDGWLNDPNGPIFYHGRYHIFYQHVVGSSSWDWGLVWGHASSQDLVTWEHEPIAIEPSAGEYDTDGCWSGTVAIDTDGTPTMLYTGVRLRAKQCSIPLPPPELDLDLEQIESQCVAHCDPGNERLTSWHKKQEPILPFPPTGLGKLTGFRDPFVIQCKSSTSPWKMIVGSGVEGQGGTILLYHSDQLSHGWEFKGLLVSGNTKPCQDGADFDLGAMWECPFFVKLQEHSGSRGSSPTWMLCVSPYPHFLKDRPTNPCLYWLGSYSNEQFQMSEAAGPKLLDLGDVLYAPTLFNAVPGRTLMVAWLQELRKGGSWDYAGCLSAPRVLSLSDGRLRQEPADEIAQLRSGEKWQASRLEVGSSQSVALERPHGQALDITLTLRRGQSRAAGVLLRAWLRAGQDGRACAEAVLVDWEKATLQVVAPDSLDSRTMTFNQRSFLKKIGGPIWLPEGGGSLQLRILIDHSLVEVFTELGQTLTTRVYRADPPAAADQRMYIFALGGSAAAENVVIHGMKSIWRRVSDLPEAVKVI